MKKIIALAALFCFAVSLHAGGAIVEKGEYVHEFEATAYFDCLGTDVYLDGSVPVRYYVVETASGNWVYHEHWLPDQMEGVFIDLSTGEVWQRTKDVLSHARRDSGGDGGMYTYTAKLILVNETTGERLMTHERFNIVADANGEIRVFVETLNCQPIGPEN